jgi:hypothetical protein
VPDGKGRSTCVQFGDQAIDALYIRVDGVTLVAANGDREGGIAELAQHLLSPLLGARCPSCRLR